MKLRLINSENRIWRAFYIFVTIASVSLILIAISYMFCSCGSSNNKCKYDKAIFVCDFRPTKTENPNVVYSSIIDVADYMTYSHGVIEITATDGRIYRTHISNVVLYSSEDN